MIDMPTDLCLILSIRLGGPCNYNDISTRAECESQVAPPYVNVPPSIIICIDFDGQLISVCNTAFVLRLHYL